MRPENLGEEDGNESQEDTAIEKKKDEKTNFSEVEVAVLCLERRPQLIIHQVRRIEQSK